MRYNENNGIQYEGKVVFLGVSDPEMIFEVSGLVIDNIIGKNLQANYDLIVFGDLDVDNINILGNFICIGSCFAKKISVQGISHISQTLDVGEAAFGDEIFAKELIARNIESRGKITCRTLDCDELVKCDGIFLATEGMMGSCVIDAEQIICGEYSGIDNQSIVVLSEIGSNEGQETSNTTTLVSNNKQDIEHNLSIMKNLDWTEYGDHLEKIANEDCRYSEVVDVYWQIVKLSELNRFKSLDQYIQAVDLVYYDSAYIEKSEVRNIIIDYLINKVDLYLYDLQYTKINQEQFSDLLYKLHKNRWAFSDIQYYYLIEKLYNRIGLKLSTVNLLLGEE